MLPKRFNYENEYKHGIIENGMVYDVTTDNLETARFEVPTDWVIIVVYNNDRIFEDIESIVQLDAYVK